VTVEFAVDWTTVSSLATGVGTFVLALATFAAVRSANRSARIAEAALQEQRRPILAPSRLEDPLQKLMFVDGHWLKATGGHAAVEHVDGIVYLGISLRNVGSGIGVCQGWAASPGPAYASGDRSHATLDEFRLQTRDLYIPAGDIGMWQGALRDPSDTTRAALAERIDQREAITVDLLYSDQVGRQRTITRFGLLPAGDETWFTTMSRHWYLDWDGPRPEAQVQLASETVLAEHEAALRQAATRAAAGASGAATDG
jgi:hypothetical protein